MKKLILILWLMVYSSVGLALPTGIPSQQYCEQHKSDCIMLSDKEKEFLLLTVFIVSISGACVVFFASRKKEW